MNIKPLDKTLVTEIRSTLADLKTRSKVVKAAGAASIGTGNLYNGDINLFPTQSYEIQNITTTLTIICFEPVFMDIFDGTAFIATFTITNQFTFNGSLDKKIVLRTTNASGTRIQLIYN